MQPSLCIAATALALSACAASPHSSTAPQPPHVAIANPASVFCIQQGGKLRIDKTQQGEHAMCALADGREVEEWAYFRQNHPAAQPQK